MAPPLPEYLIAFDFDGTLADTFAKSPSGFGVTEASQKAIADLFGPTGTRTLTLIGGPGNRAPVELINAVLERGDREEMIRHARIYAQEHLSDLSEFVPKNKGLSLEPLLQGKDVSAEILAEAFVRAKLASLTPEIGPEWPKPMPGIVEALQAVRALSSENTNVRIAVLSSGHEMFIRKCFEVWGVPQPDILITDDDLRGVHRLDAEMKVKPSVHLLALLHQAWRRKRGLGPDSIDLALEGKMRRENIFYAGDDKTRDGQLAMQSDVYFGWYIPDEAEHVEHNEPLLLPFKHWDELTDFLTTPGLSERLEKNTSIGELMKEVRSGLTDGRLPEHKRPV